jgi:hypothetical protein
MWKTILHVFILEKIFKNLLQNQQANFNQTWYKSPLGKGNSKLFKIVGPSQRGDDHKNRVRSFKSFLFMNHKARKAQIYTKVSWYSADLSLYKLWPPWVGLGHNGETIFTCVYNRGNK